MTERESMPRSVQLELRDHPFEPEFSRDDDLEEARANYAARLDLWRQQNGKEGGLAAFDLLVASARLLVHLEEAARV